MVPPTALETATGISLHSPGSAHNREYGMPPHMWFVRERRVGRVSCESIVPPPLHLSHARPDLVSIQSLLLSLYRYSRMVVIALEINPATMNIRAVYFIHGGELSTTNAFRAGAQQGAYAGAGMLSWHVTARVGPNQCGGPTSERYGLGHKQCMYVKEPPPPPPPLRREVLFHLHFTSNLPVFAMCILINPRHVLFDFIVQVRLYPAWTYPSTGE